MTKAKNEDDILAEIIKISQVIDLCFDLLSETERTSIIRKVNNQKISDIYIECYYKNLPFRTRYNYYMNNENRDTEYFFNDLTEKTNIHHPGRTGKTIYSDVKYRKKIVSEYKKKSHYTTALTTIISHLLYLDDVHSEMSFRPHSFIGELFIDMGAIDSALKLYGIDKNFFYDPNLLSILANNAIKTGNLEWAVKLIDQFIKQEPYHPSIQILKADIKRLEQRHRLKSTLSIDFSKIDELSGVEFENLLLDKFSTVGFKIESTPKTGDFGADLIVENREGSRIIIQCKRFKSKVNLKAVQEVVGAMGHYVGDYGVVITNNSFLNSAVKLAESHDIELWDGDKLVSFLAGDLSFSQIFS
jgi:HJR/Mrr/RecB family endonuclease